MTVVQHTSAAPRRASGSLSRDEPGWENLNGPEGEKDAASGVGAGEGGGGHDDSSVSLSSLMALMLRNDLNRAEGGGIGDDSSVLSLTSLLGIRRAGDRATPPPRGGRRARALGALLRDRCLPATVAAFALYGTISAGRDAASALSSSAGGSAADESTPKQPAAPPSPRASSLLEDAVARGSGGAFDGHILSGQAVVAPPPKAGRGFRGFFAKRTALDDDAERIHSAFANVADASSPFDPSAQVPFYWDIGAAPVVNVEDMLRCLPQTQASTLGTNGNGNSLQVAPGPAEGGRGSLVDVDLGSHAGIERARALGMLEPGRGPFPPVGLVVSPFLPEVAAALFSPERKGRIFTVVEQPVHRIRNTWVYLKRRGLFAGTMKDFASSDHVLANNYMTRVLSGRWADDGDLDESHLRAAESVLREKILIAANMDHHGLMAHAAKVFGWDDEAMACLYPPTNPYVAPPQDSPLPPPPPPRPAAEVEVDAIIGRRNEWDQKLFFLSVDLWRERQASIAPATR